MTKFETDQLIESALCGNKDALEKLLAEIQGLVFNLSLRMLGTLSDAEDASQEILIRIITNLSSFRRESSFSTWVYRIAANYLSSYKKSMFAMHPLSFEVYGNDIGNGFLDNFPEDTGGVDADLLAEELKLSCTNVMLQCLDPESRCIFILGTMFRLDSKTAGDILGLSPEIYRQRLSRIRKKMADFLSGYCGLSGTGSCSCKKRINYAITHNRLNPDNLEYTRLGKLEDSTLLEVKDHMETMDGLSAVFADLPKYKPTKTSEEFLQDLLKSLHMAGIRNAL